jgi:hypothetical protein
MRRRKGSTDLSRCTNEITLALGNVTYPTRNFATLGPFALLLDESTLQLVGRGHFCRALHVAMQSGLYHPLKLRAVWRTVSEDSRIRSRLLASSAFEPFLLIARPRRIFTAALFDLRNRSNGEYLRFIRGFQHMARFYNYSGPFL